MRHYIKSKYEIFKQQAYVIIYGTNTFAGRLFDILLLIFIGISVFLVMMESVENIDTRYHLLLIVLEWVITIFFTIEYILRIISNPKPLRYIFSFYGVIDLISLLPMYLSFFVVQTKMLSIIRVLRLLRIFRILSLVNFTDQANELRMAIASSRAKILVFIYFVLVICVLLGTLMFMIEDNERGFTSIPQSIYWCIVTLTTVGYGDIAPVTALGKALASVIMIMGYGIIAVPTGIVSSEYSRIQQKRERKAQRQAEMPPQICKNCNETKFPKEAAYCHKCGNPL